MSDSGNRTSRRSCLMSRSACSWRHAAQEVRCLSGEEAARVWRRQEANPIDTQRGWRCRGYPCRGFDMYTCRAASPHTERQDSRHRSRGMRRAQSANKCASSCRPWRQRAENSSVNPLRSVGKLLGAAVQWHHCADITSPGSSRMRLGKTSRAPSWPSRRR